MEQFFFFFVSIVDRVLMEENTSCQFLSVHFNTMSLENMASSVNCFCLLVADLCGLLLKGSNTYSMCEQLRAYFAITSAGLLSGYFSPFQLLFLSPCKVCLLLPRSRQLIEWFNFTFISRGLWGLLIMMLNCMI